MDKDETAELIDAAGGDAKFAELLGIEKEKWYPQRVNNWRRRGIPAQVVLDHFDIIKKLQRTVATRANQSSSATARQ